MISGIIILVFSLLFTPGGLAAPVRNRPDLPGTDGPPAPGDSLNVKVGNYFMYAPDGISMIVNDEAGFVVMPVFGNQPEWNGDNKDQGKVAYVAPGITAPDFSYVRSRFQYDGAHITFEWGKTGSATVSGIISTDKPVILTLSLPGETWPGFHNIFMAEKNGVNGYGITPQGQYIPFGFECNPEPVDVQANLTPGAEVRIQLKPDRPVTFSAEAGNAPFTIAEHIAGKLNSARLRYEAYHMTSNGDWGNFLGAIADNMNFTRLYSSDNNRIAYIVGRGWWIGRRNPNLFPYFAWDSFFNGILGSFENPLVARNTIRAVLSFQTPSGFIPLDSHWSDGGSYVTMDRSDPPVGAMAVWKINQRWPDKAFLAEVYPHLVKWHEWWMKARDGNHDGLLEWGSAKAFKQGAMWETGWDDNVEYARARMSGTTLNADAVDLNSLYSMDAEYLAKIASALGKNRDASRFLKEHEEVNKRINHHLWNKKLGIYCSRLWNVPKVVGPALVSQDIFPNGFQATYYSDQVLQHAVLHRIEYRVRHQWKNSGPAPGIPVNHWSAKWTGIFHAPHSGAYRLIVRANTGVRLFIDGKQMIDTWHKGHGQVRYADINVSKGEKLPVELRYFDDTLPGSIEMTVHKLSPGKPGSDWLTRLTPMNFYPLIAGVPDAGQAKKMLSILYNKNKFWLHRLLPTVSRDDPVWPEQGYWHGNVWPPANYLVWLGLKRYADQQHLAEYARRSVKLYMKNWKDDRKNCENYSSINGGCNGDPHYSWGALLPLIGEEALIGISDDDKPVPMNNPYIKEHIVLKHVPVGGILYTVVANDGKVEISREENGRRQ